MRGYCVYTRPLAFITKKMDKEIFNQIAESLKNKKLKRTCVSLSKSFKPTKQSDLQRVYDLVIKLYLENCKSQILLISSDLEEIEFTGNFNLWTWIEATLLIRCKILYDTDDLADFDKTLSKIKIVETYEWDEELKTNINRKVRKRRIEERSLLKYDKLKAVIEGKDLKSELEVRIRHYVELLFIFFLSEIKPLDIKKEIEENEKKMLTLYNKS